MGLGSSHLLVDLIWVLVAVSIFVLGLLTVATVLLYILDVTQTRHALRHNYPVIGRFRKLFESFGVFLRRYGIAMDREEMPFNRAERDWVYRASKSLNTNQSFGSTRDLRPGGTLLFVNHPFPMLEHDVAVPGPVTIGEDCPYPYTTASFFNISGMSYGAISRPAVQALSMGSRIAGCWLNTGEGGLTPEHLASGCDLIFQIGTAKYGVRSKDGSLSDGNLRTVAAHSQVRMFELKLSQGAKPGKGGILPGSKVTSEVARIRGIPVAVDSISPNRFPEIDSEGALLDLIDRVRRVAGKPVGFKCVLGAGDWLDNLLSLICRRGIASAPDFITLDGAEGGTGSSPASLMDYMGLPLRESLPILVDKLHEYGLRDRIKVIASGKLINPADVAWALCVGADFVTSARGFMFALGCIQALRCHTNRCPTGVTTHNPRLQQGLDPNTKAKRVANYASEVAHEVGVIAHACGVHQPRQLSRRHCRIVSSDGQSQSLSELHPIPQTKADLS